MEQTTNIELEFEKEFQILSEKAISIMDDSKSWATVKEAKTKVGVCRLMKRKCHEKGFPDYYVGAECTFEGRIRNYQEIHQY
jgi:hypothetical protein